MNNASVVLSSIKWEKELRSAKFPTDIRSFRNKRVEAAESLAMDFIAKKEVDKKVYEAFNSKLKVIFMMKLEAEKPKVDVLEKIESVLNVTLNETNPEILLYWYTLNIPERVKNEVLRGGISKYLEQYGREKYIKPVYKLLATHDNGYARDLFELSLIHICRCRRYAVCRSRWSPYH
eukprot:TRINITY_DN10678_c0_g1_i10.p4 TRINITY_DN10678_c0_g1~~TRINITY_DN10678_c0_g1_i10.p4  ORF type:complete len:177 (-),score=63.25 TRINITY_DN10678_c0_g1_i10:39-569(-)